MKKEKRLLLFLVLVLVVALFFSVVPASAGENPGRVKSLAEAGKVLEQELLPLAGAGFVGIAHSEAEGEIIVFVEDEQTKQRVPRSMEGYTVRTEVTGKIQALSTQVVAPLNYEERRGEVRPLVGGTSLSAWVPNEYYAGTLGMITYDERILSNAHVIAMEPDTDNFLALGTPIIQPGSGDLGNMGDRVGGLADYIPIDFDNPGAENYADAAIGSIDDGIEASPGEQFDEGGNYWIEGWTEVSNGDIVRKSGRTSGVTTGEVINTNANVAVYYGDQLAYFVSQIIVEQVNWSFAAPGDSGSAVDKDGEFVGLVFAGTADYVFINKAEHIIDGLGIAVEPLVNQYSLTISSTPGGSVTLPGEGMFIYDAETVVPLVAEADIDNHYDFVNWTGDVGTIADVNDPMTTITVNDSYSITANFELDPGWYSLTTASTEGGSVTNPGEGISVHAADTTVDLVAEPSTHYHFVEWTGDVSTIADVYATSTNITMNASYSVTANFERDLEPVVLLTVSSTTGGAVTIPGEGTLYCPLGSKVSLVATAVSGYQFTNWSGDVSTIADVNDASTTITMDSSHSIIANFGMSGFLLCFIATAAYGTPMAEEIGILRDFRDEYLLTNPLGKALVEFYYRVSPPIAEFIIEHPGLKPIVRAVLLPAVAMSTVAVNTSPAEKTAIMGLLVLVSVALAIWETRRRGRGPQYT